MKYRSIDYEYLGRYIYYNPSTGIMTRKVTTGPSGREGNEAGYRHHTGYLMFILNGKEYQCHRVAYAIYHSVRDFNEIDHINGNRSDNRIENLRCVNRSENQQNKAVNSNNTSGHTGVYFDKRRGRWFSIITKDRIRYKSGFLSYEDSCTWYRDMKSRLHHIHPEYVDRENEYRRT